MKAYVLLGLTLLLWNLSSGECGRIKLLPDHFSSRYSMAGNLEFGADRKDFPHQVALLLEHAPDHTELLCSGAIIHKYIVLAAAHCFDDVPLHAKILVVAGDEMKPQIRRVARIIIHPEYTPFTHLNQWDVALLELRVPLVLNDTVRAIKLGCGTPQGDATYAYWAGAANHGLEGKEPPQGQLVYGTVSLLDAPECQARMDLLDLPLDPVHLCTYHPHSGRQSLTSKFSRFPRKDPGGLLIQESQTDEKTIIGYYYEVGLHFRITGVCEWISKKISSYWSKQ